jgi:hypothetical protein
MLACKSSRGRLIKTVHGQVNVHSIDLMKELDVGKMGRLKSDFKMPLKTAAPNS